MIGFWVSFAIIALLVPIGLASWKVWAEKRISYTDEQKKNASLNIFGLWMFYWLCDLFYMACFIDNLICKFVFGSLIMVIVLMEVCSAFVSSGKRTRLQKFAILQDFIVVVGLSVYLIYLIPNKELQTIIIAIVASLYGGLITLAGVAWTIKKSDKDRAEDEIKREKPCFSFNPLISEAKIYGSEKVSFPAIENEKQYKCEVQVQLENSDKSPLILKKLFHDGNWVDLEGNLTLLPSGKCYLSFYFDSPFNIVLTIEDILGNEYYYLLKVLRVAFPNNAKISSSNRFFHTLREIKEISKEELLKTIKDSKRQEEKDNGKR